MTCYLNKLKPVLEKAGHDTLTKNQRKIVDQTVRAVTGAKGRCPQVWPVVEEWIKDPAQEQRLIKEIQDKLVEPCP
ncbi:hypothetical protein [Desulfotomaculum sp. 1211_IL3151]|uniref:hypothetical protein n=1 Tax=Desulfotomaculum sp. 1211_IL3151 TaxID=3084055 RepID=UPI002FDA4096